MSTPESGRQAPAMERMAGYLVRERAVDGSATAFGPLLPSSDCLACFSRRREASPHPPGELSLLPLDEAGAQDGRLSALHRHQLREGHPPQPFLPPADCDRHCGIGPFGTRASAGAGHGPAAGTSPQAPPSAAIRCGTDGLPDVRAAIGSHTGLIRALQLSPAPDGHWTAIAQGQATPGTAGIAVLCHGTATAADPDTALTLAVCEALERYCAGFWAPQALRGRRRRPATAGAGPTASDRQVVMRRLGGGTPVWIPAERVYLPFGIGGHFHDGDSVGLACGRDIDDARGRAVAELIERWVVMPWLDQLLRGHRGRATPGGGPSVPEHTDERAWTLAHVRLGRQALHVAAAVRLQPAPPWCALGFGCHPDPAHARLKAAHEARHVQSHLRQWAARAAPPVSVKLSGLDADLHALAFEPGAAARLLAVLPPTEGAPPPPRRRLASGRVLWRDITTRDVAELGLAVVRAALSER
ncbi:YcaO-like family protein [Pseudaquabacterium rugosum]|uniref:YcaO-like family protein n=1 Tax=Pseudaquabacterium rugosum TaxID=2984194 RepID=A0ABU9BCT3_9BURK